MHREQEAVLLQPFLHVLVLLGFVICPLVCSFPKVIRCEILQPLQMFALVIIQLLKEFADLADVGRRWDRFAN